VVVQRRLELKYASIHGVQFLAGHLFALTIKPMKKLLSILFLLVTLNLFGAASYYGKFYGDAYGLTNFNFVKTTNIVDIALPSAGVYITNSSGSNLAFYASCYTPSGSGGVAIRVYNAAGVSQFTNTVYADGVSGQHAILSAFIQPNWYYIITGAGTMVNCQRVYSPLGGAVYTVQSGGGSNPTTNASELTTGTLPDDRLTEGASQQSSIPVFARKPFWILTVGASQAAGIYTFTNAAWVAGGTNFLPNGAVGDPYWPWPHQVWIQMSNSSPMVYSNLTKPNVLNQKNGLYSYASGGTGSAYQSNVLVSASSGMFNTNSANGAYNNLYQAPKNGGTNILLVLDGVDNDLNTNGTLGSTVSAVLSGIKANYLTNVGAARAWGTNVFICVKTAGSATDWGGNSSNNTLNASFHATRELIRNQLNDWIRTNLAQQVDWVYDEGELNAAGKHPDQLSVDGIGHGNLAWHQIDGAQIYQTILGPRKQVVKSAPYDVPARNVVLQPNGALLLEQFGTRTNAVATDNVPVSSMWSTAISNTPSGAKFFGDGSALTGVGSTLFYSVRQTNDQVTATNFTSCTNSTDLQITVPAGDWQGVVYVAMDGAASGGGVARITNSPPCQFGGYGLSGVQSGALLSSVNQYHSGWENGTTALFAFHAQSSQYSQCELRFNAHTTNTTTFIIQFGQNSGTVNAATFKAGNTMNVWGKAR
jgi:hypothetical protein